MGIRIKIDIPVIITVFLPFLPPNMKINSSTNGKRISLPYRVITIIN
jgi:hypothetical protein